MSGRDKSGSSGNRTRAGAEIAASLGEIRADRRLLLPGPQPALSHLGATLLRHSVHTGLRYALYQLGYPGCEAPPTRFVALRLYLDAPALRDALGTGAGVHEILGALLDPGGRAVEPLPKRVSGALWFHRWRLRLLPPRLETRLAADLSVRKGLTRERLSELLPALGDALLGELIASLDRRRARTHGREVSSSQSVEAARFLAGATTDLSRLGLPDPMVPSWRDRMPPIESGGSVHEKLLRPRHRLRGGFRELYRRLLDHLRPSLLDLGDRAVAKGFLASKEDLFFLPLDLIDDLESEVKPPWLDGAIESNRSEWQELGGRRAPSDTLGNVEPAPRIDLPGELVPLWPLE